MQSPKPSSKPKKNTNQEGWKLSWAEAKEGVGPGANDGVRMEGPGKAGYLEGAPPAFPKDFTFHFLGTSRARLGG